jgi:hypothetical protein
MSMRKRSLIFASLAGVIAGATWIGLADPAFRVGAVDRIPDRAFSRVESPSLEPPNHGSEAEVSTREPVASKEGSPVLSEVDLERATETDPRIVLFGSATDPGGRPLSFGGSLSLALTDDRGERTVSKIEEGRYSIAGLRPGEWRLSVRTPGIIDLDRRVVLAASERMHREDIVLERAWSIAVLLKTQEGKGLYDGGEFRGTLRNARFSAIATTEPPGERLPTTDLTHFVDYGVGRFFENTGLEDGTSPGLPREAIGRLIVLGHAPIHVSLVLRQFVLETKPVDSTIDSLTFELSLERLRSIASSFVLRVVDGQTDQPIEGATVMVTTSQSGGFGPRSGSDGVVRCSGYVPGRYSLRTSAKGFAVDLRVIDLEPGRETDVGTIQLSSPSVLAGRIVDPDGHGIQAQPSLVPYLEGAPEKSLMRSLSGGLHVEEDGRFRQEGLATGRYLLLFGAEFRHPPAQNEPEWTCAPLLIDTKSVPVENLEVVLRRGAELVMKPIAPSVVGTEFLILTLEGLPYRRGRFYESSPTLLRIAPGTYELVLTRDGAELRRMHIDVPETGTTIEIAP